MQLVYDKTMKPVREGDRLPTFRGEMVTITGWCAPRHEGSTGRVYVKFDGHEDTCEYFPSVVGCSFVRR